MVLGGEVSFLFDVAFTGSFPHFSYKEVPDLQKNNFLIPILIIFLIKYLGPLPFCLQHSWNPEQNKVSIFAKSVNQEVTRCHRLQTLYKI